MIKTLLNQNWIEKSRNYKIVSLFIFSFACFFYGNSQTTHINPTGNGGFENGATFAANGWTATTGGATQNQWVCNTGATAGFSGLRAAYVTQNTGASPPPHTYNPNTTRVTHIYRAITIPAGEINIQLNFDWIGVGEDGFFGTYDYLRVWKVPNTNGPNLPNYGTALTANANRIILAELVDQNTWTNLNITLPSNLAGTTFRLVFEWTNDDSVGNNPPAAVDNISLISEAPSGYCTPTFTTTVEPITNVTYAGINNTTSNVVGAPTPDYESFTDTATVLPGGTNAISVKGNTAGNFTTYIRAYIDWDQSLVFGDNANEIYDLGTIANSNGVDAVTLMSNITVPAAALIGTTKMRVMKRFNAYSNSPCQTGAGYGQTEDYNVEVILPLPPTITTLSNTNGCEGSTLTINGTNLAGASAVTIGGTAATITANTTTSVTVTVGTGTTGTVTVTAPGGSATSVQTFTVNPLPATPPTPTSTGLCNPAGVTITRVGTPPAGITWYWQTFPNGTTTTDSGPTLSVNTSSNYFLRARNNTTGCWSDNSAVINVTVNNPISSLASSPSPANNATGVCFSGTGAITGVNWNAAAGATNYDVYFGTNATPPFIGNQAGTAYSTGALAANTTYYWRIVPYGPCGVSTGTPITWSFTTNNGPCVCIPSSTSSSNYIDDFSTTNGQTNITNNNTGYAAGGYADYTSLIASQVPGGNLTFNADFIYGFGGMGVGIWVDWNNDADFNDANEQIYNSAGYIPNLNFNYTIPSVAAGTYRLRILADYWEPSPDACFFDDYFGSSGEAEDYSLTIVALNCTANPQSLTAVATTTTTATVSWNAPAPPPANGYEYIISTDNTTTTPAGDITGTTTVTSLNLTGLTPNTTYYVFVRGVCNATDNGVWITVNFNTGCADLVTTPIICGIIAGEQGTNPFTVNPFDPDPSFLLDCAAATVTLEAHSQLKETTSYIVEKIDYNPPVAFIGFGSSSVNLTDDDVWADNRSNIGFDFCFYDNSYSQLLVGANGMVTFNPAITPGSGSGYAFSNNLPSTAGALFEQTIYATYHDIDPAPSIFDEISTRIVDPTNIGCRKFVVSWHDVPMFSDNSILFTGMLVLHETTNIIEVFIEEKRIDNNNLSPWNGGNAIVGIQGDYVGPASNPANEYAVAPCRNGLDDNWETTNEAWRFVPDGADILPSLVNWYAGAVAPGNLVGTGTTLPVNSPDTYIAEATYPSCNGPITLTDTVIVSGGNTWTSAAGTSDWNTAGNWSNNTVPTDSDVVIIPDMSTTSGRFPIILGGAPLPPLVSQAGCLTVENNGYVEVRNGGRLIVTGAITVQESATLTDGNLLIRSGGNLVQITEGPTNTNNNTGPIKMQRSVTGVASDSYIYWSSPVEDFNVQGVSPGSTNIFEWVPTTGSVYGNWVSPTNPNMTQGKGYIIRNILGTNPEAGTITPIGTTAEFIGVPRNGVLTTPINRGNHLTGTYPGAGNTLATPLDDNWNLIGNPYPSSISADEFISENAANITNDVNPAISGTIWLWRHENTTSNITNDPFYGDYVYNYNANQYAAYNLSGSNPAGFNGNIASGQGFFVLMEDLVGPGPTPILNADITFTNTMRYFTISGDNDAFDNTSFLRTETDESTTSNSIERHRIWLDLIKPNNTATSILVGYIENATNDIDRLYDGYDLNTYGVRLYSIIDDKELSIQGRTLPFDQDDIVPLGVVIGDNGIHQIAINALDGLFENESQGIYLEDTYTNTIHDLRANTYSFTSESGTFNDRFILRYTTETLGVNSAQIDSGISIIAPRSEYIKISSSIGVIQTVNIYDVLGRVIFSEQNINNHEFILNDTNLANGAYIVKVELTNGKQKIKTVVLKH